MSASMVNPRVLVVAVSIAALVPLSKIDDPRQTVRRAIIASACFFVLYLLAFLLPLRKTFGLGRIVAPFFSLLAAWISVALSIIADAWPISFDEPLTRHVNVPMWLACIAGAASFYLFFTHTSRAFALRSELREINGQ